MDLSVLWAFVLVLIALAVVGWMLPPTRKWHTAGIATLCVLGVFALGTATAVTWSAAVLTEDELYDAARKVSDRTAGAPGDPSAQQVMALISDEVDRDVFADSADRNATETRYNVTPVGKDSPVVCVRVIVSEGTATALQDSFLEVDSGPCE